MADQKRTKRKKSEPKRRRKERRFTPEPTSASRLSLIVGALGSFALGAGVWAEWIQDEPLEQAPFIVAGGAVALGLALWFGEVRAFPVRIGDAGIAIEKGSELIRLAWCDMNRIHLEKDQLIAESSALSIKLPISAHRTAIAWIFSESVRRLPDLLEVRTSEADRFPKPQESDGQLLTIDAVQIAGRPCAASKNPISFERDARLCPNCAQAYHRNHVPQKCVTCDNELAGRTMSIS